MARRGRPRKAGKRTASGRLKERATAEERRVKPTPEMARKKAAVDGREIEDPLSYLPLDPGAVEALGRFRSAAWSAGFRPARMVARVDPTPRGLDDEEAAQIAELRARAKYESGLGAALLVSKAAHDAVRDFSQHWGGPWSGNILALNDGALAMAEEWHIHTANHYNILRRA